MKTQKLITIDEEIVELLRKEDNASQLINRLLLEHYKKNSLDMMTENELMRELEIAEYKQLKEQEINDKIKEINEKWAK